MPVHDSRAATPARPLVAVFELVTTGIGGVQKVMQTVLPRLGEEFDVVAIDPNGYVDYARSLQDLGVTTVGLGRPPRRKFIGGKGTLWRPFLVLRRAPWMLLTFWRFRRWVRRHRPAVIYFNLLPVVRWAARVVPRAVPLVYHAHGFRSAGEIGPATARYLSGRFARIIAVSQVTRDLLVAAGVEPGIIRVVYNAVDAGDVQTRARADGPPLPPRAPGSVVFAHVATVMEAKGQHLAVEALSLHPALAHAHLWICGGLMGDAGPDYVNALRARAGQLGLSERVHFLGWRDDVPRVLAAADVCILPTPHTESFGMVLAEAMALGKPCVGTRVGGIPEVIADGVTGLICEVNAASLAEAMGRLAESGPLRSALGQAGLARVQTAFTVERQVAGIAQVLRDALGAGA
jgi:glycosyltransferase involved in cell wall biosynthesis